MTNLRRLIKNLHIISKMSSFFSLSSTKACESGLVTSYSEAVLITGKPPNEDR